MFIVAQVCLSIDFPLVEMENAKPVLYQLNPAV
jgi:hypothetical protein